MHRSWMEWKQTKGGKFLPKYDKTCQAYLSYLRNLKRNYFPKYDKTSQADLSNLPNKFEERVTFLKISSSTMTWGVIMSLLWPHQVWWWSMIRPLIWLSPRIYDSTLTHNSLLTCILPFIHKMTQGFFSHLMRQTTHYDSIRNVLVFSRPRHDFKNSKPS
jgi:hypothetical protein